MSYTPTTWADGDLITAQKLNNIEQGITQASTTIQGISMGSIAPGEVKTFSFGTSHFDGRFKGFLITYCGGDSADSHKGFSVTGITSTYVNTQGWKVSLKPIISPGIEDLITVPEGSKNQIQIHSMSISQGYLSIFFLPIKGTVEEIV